MAHVHAFAYQMPMPMIPRSQRSLYIGNLSPDVTDQLLYEVFSIVGLVESAKVIKDKTPAGRSSFGFVDYFDPGVAAIAQEKMNGKKIYEYEMKVNWAQAAGQSTGGQDSSLQNIFVGDLSADVDEKGMLAASCRRLLLSRM
jgi:nucleolysin TIA-1/TIAR